MSGTTGRRHHSAPTSPACGGGANEPEEAAEEARRVIDASGDLSSERTAHRARTVLRRLQAYEDVPEARAVLADHGQLLFA
ncbi:hypothetical protein [Streptomyces rubradiris]|uniref:Uncharacterized protein n=1 Tax=Streptomyces rubradiris TaxID=285531 RepID=A0ABQ3REV5_STRRR|nr:hypothetical protein [Streptomyces rubradiris]GHG97818.1 hypothetical protein GCM10018792_09960 [Streptomyces rubradiris]GHI54385.1 hypothetical protein Srubr_42310 [Streptomyces rubradiris]